jgi:hypothetical protein
VDHSPAADHDERLLVRLGGALVEEEKRQAYDRPKEIEDDAFAARRFDSQPTGLLEPSAELDTNGALKVLGVGYPRASGRAAVRLMAGEGGTVSVEDEVQERRVSLNDSFAVINAGRHDEGLVGTEVESLGGEAEAGRRLALKEELRPKVEMPVGRPSGLRPRLETLGLREAESSVCAL